MAPRRRQGALMTCVSTKLPARRGTVLVACGYAALVAAAVLPVQSTHAADRLAYMAVASESRAPIGWIEFCAQEPTECAGGTSTPRDVVLSPRAWRDLVQINTWVNTAIKPMTDVDHWGVVE